MTEFFGSSDFCAYSMGSSKLSSPEHAMGFAMQERLEKSQRRLARYAGLEMSHNLRIHPNRFDAISDLIFAYATQMAKTSGKNYILALKTPLMEEIAAKFANLGLRFDWLESNHPILTKEVFAKHLRPRTGLVLVPWVCPYTGVVQPVIETLDYLREEGAGEGIMVLLDATNAMGNLFFELKELKADGYLFEMEGLGTLLATLPMMLWEKSLRNWITSQEIEKLEAMSLAIETKWLDLESRSFERASLKAYFEDRILQMGWKVHFQDCDRILDFTCIEAPLHSHHLSYLLQKQQIAIYHSEAVRQKIASYLGDKESSPLLIKWNDATFTEELVEQLLEALAHIQKKSQVSTPLNTKVEEPSYVLS